jgi:hypothetical protein
VQQLAEAMALAMKRSRRAHLSNSSIAAPAPLACVAHCVGLPHVESLIFLGRYDDAHAVAAELVRPHPDDVELRGLLGIIAVRRGDLADARAADAWLANRPAHNSLGIPVYDRARMAAHAGDVQAALTLLESMPYGAHPADPLLFHSDPAFEHLRVEPRFRATLRRRDPAGAAD